MDDSTTSNEALIPTTDKTMDPMNVVNPEDIEQDSAHTAVKQSHPKATHTDYSIRANEHGKLALYNNNDKPICGPIWVNGIARDTDSTGWSHIVDFYDQDDNKHRWLMPREMIGAPYTDVFRELLGRGLWESGYPYAGKEIHEYLKRGKQKRFTTTKASGWHNDGKAFVMPNGECMGEGDYFLRDARPQRAVTGTLQDWRDNVASLCVGNSRLTMATSIGFASPLLKLEGADSVGFHFVGKSSVGKSRAAHVASSVFGVELIQWKLTGNGLEGKAARHSDVGLVMDEIGQCSAKEVGEISYMLANGSGKARATQSGSDRKVQTWRAMYLSTGELTMADHMGTVGGQAKAGQELRLLNIEADVGKGMGLFDHIHDFEDSGKFANHVNEVAKQYTGTAGPEFIRYLIKHRDHVGALVQEVRQQFEQEAGIGPTDDGQVKRAAGHFALVAAAGELATEAGVTGWPKGEAIRGACVCFASWRNAWSPNGSREAEIAIEQVRAFIQTEASRFECKTHTPRDRAGYAKEDGREFWIFPNVFKSEVCKGMRYKLVAKALADAGFLEVDKKGKRSVPRRPEKGGKLQRFYVIKEAILGDDEQE